MESPFECVWSKETTMKIGRALTFNLVVVLAGVSGRGVAS